MIQQAQHSQSLNFDEKETQQVIHQSPNLNVLKKMFARPKKYMTIKHNDESLLFDRNNSVTMLKAHQNRKKTLIEQSQRKKQNQFTKRFPFSSSLNSPQKADFMVESVKYNFEQSSKRKEYYEKMLQLINEASHFQRNKSQQIKQRIADFNLNLTKNVNNNLLQSEYFIQSLNLQGNQIPRLNPKKIHSSTLSPRDKTKKLYGRFLQRNIKSLNEQILADQSQKIKSSDQNYFLNPQKQEQKQSSVIKDFKIKKLISNPQTQLSLPKIKIIKSITNIDSQNNNLRKGYMFFHPQAKPFIKQHRQKLNDEAKIQSMMISGISAANYAVIDLQTMTPIAYKNFNKKIEIASISKVMTCYLSLLACKKYKIDQKKYLVRVSRQATQLNGTSAEFQQGDCITLQQALYALMLPSGNDASFAIAQTIGKIIQRHKTKQTKKSYYETFIAHMNLLSRELKLQQEWKNSSGLPSNPNHSTPQSVCLLTIAAMMDEKFKQIVSCKEYETTIKNQRTGLRRIIKWKNTNKLLNEGWQGVKTGTTESAGHCLIAKKDRYLIAVFDTNSLSKRFTECSQLYSLVKSKQRYLFPEKWD